MNDDKFLLSLFFFTYSSLVINTLIIKSDDKYKKNSKNIFEYDVKKLYIFKIDNSLIKHVFITILINKSSFCFVFTFQ